MDGGSEKIDDARELAIVRAQARRVLAKSLAATLATAIAMFIAW